MHPSDIGSPRLFRVLDSCTGTRSRADKNPGVLRLPCRLVEAECTVNYGRFDLLLYCLSTWVHTSNLVLLPQLA